MTTDTQPMATQREFGQFLSDVMTAAGLVTHGKQCKALGDRLADMCVRLRRWGQPAHSGEPVAWRIHPFDYGIGSQGVYAITSLPQQRDAWLRRGWKAEPLYTTPQPTQPQAGAVPLALHQRDSIKANAWRETPLHGYFDADEIIDAIEAAHGIK